MFLTKKQDRVLKAQLPPQRSSMIPSERLEMPESTIHSYNTLIFQNFREALELMADPDVFEVFKGRFKKHGDSIWTNTRQLRARLKEVL